MIDKETAKLFRAYEKAEVALCAMRDELFPVGSVVRSRITPDYVAKIKGQSIYPDKVNTTYGHMSWRYLEIVPTPPTTGE